MKIHNAEKFLAPALPYAIGMQPTPRETAPALLLTQELWPRLVRRKIVGRYGSQNIPLLAGAAGLGLTGGDDHWDLLKRWRRYAGGPWWAGEPGTRNVYGSWIMTSIMAAWSFARISADEMGKLNESQRPVAVETAARLRVLIRSSAVMMVLGATPDGNVTLCGARSAISEKKGRTRRDDTGRALRPRFLFGRHSFSHILESLLVGNSKGVPGWEGAVFAAATLRTSIDPASALTGFERKILRRCLLASRADSLSTRDMALVVKWLKIGPKPKIGLAFWKTSAGAATICEQSVNFGSTATMYAMARWNSRRPPKSALDSYSWGDEDRRVDALWLDNPAFRGRAKAGRSAVLQSGHVIANRLAGDHFDDDSQTYRAGQKRMRLPDGEMIWHFRVGPRNVHQFSGPDSQE